MKTACSLLATAAILGTSVAILPSTAVAATTHHTHISKVTTTASATITKPVTVYETFNPDTGATYLTTSASDAVNSAKRGYTRNLGALFVASSMAQAGYSPIHRLYNINQGYIYITTGTEYTNAIKNYGWKDQGVKFYAPTTAVNGMQPVYRLATPDGHYLFTMDSITVHNDLTRNGWQDGSANFYVLPANNPNTIWVTTNGTGDGSSASSATTVDNAKTLAEQRLKNATGDVTVVYADGLYRRGTPITLTSVDSGTNGHKMVWMTAPGAMVTFDGSQQVTGWEQWSGHAGVWRAKTTAALNNGTRTIYVNGVQANLTQAKASDVLGTIAPSGQFDNDPKHAGWFAGYDVTKDISSWPDLAHTTLRWYGNRNSGDQTYMKPWWGWTDRYSPIGSATANHLNMIHDDFYRVAPGDANSGVKIPNYIQNNINLLGTPGQFYIDQTEGWIYYTPRNGEEMTTADVEVPVSQGIVKAAGVSNFTMDGIGFQHDKWDVPTQRGWADGQNATEWGVTVPGSVEFTQSNNISFNRTKFYQTGGSGLEVHDNSNNVSITNGVAYQTGANAISVGEADRNSSSMNNVISGETVDTTGTIFPSAAGVFVGVVGNSSFTHNHVRNTSYSGLSFGMGWDASTKTQTNNRIENNEFTNTVNDSNLFDGGAIYVNGMTDPANRSTIKGNWIDGVGTSYDETDTSHFTGGVNAPKSAIYLDGNSSNWDVSGNVVQNTHKGVWLALQTVDGQVALNNTVTGNWADTAAADTGNPANTVTNNTIFTPDNAPAVAVNVYKAV